MAARQSSPLIELTKMRVREFLREPGALFWVFGFPILMAVGLGFAFRSQPERKPIVAVLEGEQALFDRLDAAQVERSTMSEDDARRALSTGKVDVVVRPDDQGGYSLAFDPARENSALGKLVVENVLQKAHGRQDAVPITSTVTEQQGSRYIDFLIPGLLGLNLMGSSMWGIGYSLVLARKRRLLRRLAATPMRRRDLLGAYTLSRLFGLVLEVGVLLLFGWLAFDVTVKGSIAGVCLVSALGAGAFAGLALLVGARVQSLEAANGWLNFVMLPMWLLSGSFFSYERFPEVVHLPIRLLPLTALNDALRAVINDGETLLSVAPEMGVMALWAVVGFVVAARGFRWQ